MLEIFSNIPSHKTQHWERENVKSKTTQISTQSNLEKHLLNISSSFLRLKTTNA